MSSKEKIAHLTKKNTDQKVEISSLKLDKSNLESQLSEMKKLIFGSKSEKFAPKNEDVKQLSFFAKPEVEQQETEPNSEQVSESQTITYKRKNTSKSTKGNKIPSHFPIEERVIEPDQDISDMIKVGEEVSEYVEYTAAELKAVRVIRPKYVSKDKKGAFVIAELPNRAYPKSITSPSMMSWLITRKFVEHMPFYRQLQAIKRDYAWDISSSTINDWFTVSCTMLEPLYELLKKKVLQSGYVQADESPIKVMDKINKGKCHLGYQWVYHSPELKLLFFEYRKGRGVNGPKEVLGSYSGLLQCDGYKVYDKIAKTIEVKLAGCMAHLRRYYHKALESDKELASYALEIFKQVYQEERKCKEFTSKQRYEHRKTHSYPLIVKLKKWVDKYCISVLPKSPIGKAMTYTNNQWPKIQKIFEDGRFELDNNLIENKIRPLALGRKNYLFAGSHKGGQRIAMMYSFFGSCAALNINPKEWLKNTLEKINDTKLSQLDSLLPGAVNP